MERYCQLSLDVEALDARLQVRTRPALFGHVLLACLHEVCCAVQRLLWLSLDVRRLSLPAGESPPAMFATLHCYRKRLAW